MSLEKIVFEDRLDDAFFYGEKFLGNNLYENEIIRFELSYWKIKGLRPVYFLSLLEVKEEFRKKGYGTKTIEFLKNKADSRGAFLILFSGSHNRGFYLKNGFKEFKNEEMVASYFVYGKKIDEIKNYSDLEKYLGRKAVNFHQNYRNSLFL